MVTHDISQAISMSNRIIVLSKRPAIVKNEYKLEWDCNDLPSMNREKSNFSKYYNQIWSDLDEQI